jgi:LuxR family maltose regulon positive regulatory protein
LVALSLQGRTDVEPFIAAFTGTHRYILDYMTEEILRRQRKTSKLSCYRPPSWSG